MTVMLKVHQDDIHREVSKVFGEQVAAWVQGTIKNSCRVGGCDFLFCRYDYLGDPEASELFPGWMNEDGDEFDLLEAHNREWVKAHPESAEWWRLGFADEFTAVGFDRELWGDE